MNKDKFSSLLSYLKSDKEGVLGGIDLDTSLCLAKNIKKSEFWWHWKKY